MKKIAFNDEESPVPASSRRLASGGSRGSRGGSGLTVLPLVALIFYEVSGGPFGIEESVQDAGGPFIPLLLYIVMPLIWSLPEALVTAELSTAFPEDSGSVAWVESAFGEGVGFCSGVWSWLSGVCDNAIYPVLFAEYLVSALPTIEHGLMKDAFTLSVALLWTIFNWLGLHVVGKAATLLMVASLAPFGIMSLLAIPHLQPQRWLGGATQRNLMHKVKWNKLINIVFWNVNYWDSISTLSGEVEDISAIPRAMGGAMVATVAGYLIPLAAASGLCIARTYNPITHTSVHEVMTGAALDSPICQKFCEPAPPRWVGVPALPPSAPSLLEGAGSAAVVHARHAAGFDGHAHHTHHHHISAPGSGGLAGSGVVIGEVGDVGISPQAAALDEAVTHAVLPRHSLAGPCRADGYFQYVAAAVGGQWLYVWLAVAALCSNFGQFQAEMASDSFMLLGMAERGMLPSCFARRSRFHTPTLGIICSMLGICLIVLLRLDTIISLVNLFYIGYIVLEFAAFLRLRVTKPDLHRSFRVPLGLTGCTLMLVPACVMMFILLATTPVYELLGTVALMMLTALFYPLMTIARRKGWATFHIPAGRDPLPSFDDDPVPLYDAHSGDSSTMADSPYRMR